MNLPVMHEPAFYTEQRSAVRPLLVFHGFFWPLLLIGSFVALLLTDNPSVYIPGVILGWFGSVALGGLYLGQVWPIGIRVDEAGIWIGGLSQAARRRTPEHAEGREQEGKLPRVRARRRQVYFCPWHAIKQVEVVTERQEIRKLAKLGRSVGANRSSAAIGRVLVGPLTAPYMRAALVFAVDLSAAAVPEFQPPDTKRYWFKTSAPQQFTFHPVWSAPTRHPEKLRAALEQAGARTGR